MESSDEAAVLPLDEGEMSSSLLNGRSQMRLTTTVFVRLDGHDFLMKHRISQSRRCIRHITGNRCGPAA